MERARNQVSHFGHALKSEEPVLATGADNAPQAAAVDASEFLLWQLADSSLPTGGFAHSSGLEAAWHHGEVRRSQELESFAQASLRQAGCAALPFVMAAHAEPHRLSALDRLCDAFTTNHVANRASRWQGRAFRSAVTRIFGNAPRPWPIERESPLGHYAPIFGACLRALDLDDVRTGRLFLFVHIRGLLSAAVRLNIVGPLEAQSLQHRLGPRIELTRQECASMTLADLAQPSPLLDLWQGAHDRLYSRLFQS